MRSRRGTRLLLGNLRNLAALPALHAPDLRPPYVSRQYIHIPDLLPDLRFPALLQDEDALRYSFEAKRAAMEPYIVAHWGWDEALQRRLHRERFDEKPFFRIVWRGEDIGTVSLMRLADCVRFGEFYLFPAHQRRGIGSAILSHCLALADAEGMPVRLEHLKWNPVGTLYRRHGFAVVGETEIHWLMERPPVQ